MTPQEMKARTQRYAHRCVDVAEALPESRFSRVAADQLIRSGMSVGANYRAACRGRSPAEFVAKLGIVEEETDETLYWLEAIIERGRVSAVKLAPLLNEGEEVLKIITASIRTARDRRKKRA